MGGPGHRRRERVLRGCRLDGSDRSQRDPSRQLALGDQHQADAPEAVRRVPFAPADHPEDRRGGEGLLSPVGAQSSDLQCPRTQLPDVCRGPLQLEPAVLQVGVPHRQVRPWTRAPPIDAVDQAREAALLTLLAHRLRVSPHSMGQLWEGCFLVLTELKKKLGLKKKKKKKKKKKS